MSMAPNEVEEGGSDLRNQTLRLSTVVILPMVLKSAIELDIIDTLCVASEGRRLSPYEITEIISSKNPEAPLILDRVLRFLALHSIIDCSIRTKENGETERVYGAKPICKFLCKNQQEGSLAYMFLLNHDKVFIESWYHLSDAILEGGVPFNRAHGMSAFEYFEQDQRLNEIFNRTMSKATTKIIKNVVETYQGFQGVKVLVDVGGGNGAALSIITSKYPQIKAINYDLPHVVANAPTYTGVEHVEGDMFEKVPEGDAIFLKGILHDWDDDHCIKILKNCFEALPNGGKAIIVEFLLHEVPSSASNQDIVCGFDLLMLTQHHGGKERTQKEYQALALKSGFSTSELKSRHGNYGVTEFFKI